MKWNNPEQSITDDQNTFLCTHTNTHTHFRSGLFIVDAAYRINISAK